MARQVFTSSGTFVPPEGVTEVDVLIVAGGGAGGTAGSTGGGGGAGGVRYVRGIAVDSPVSVTVGTGGVGVTATAAGQNGGNSSFGDEIALGGGGGAAGGSIDAGSGGSGGGGAATGSAAGAPGQGTLGQGREGGDGRIGGQGDRGAGGGGGASGKGGNASNSGSMYAGSGGEGINYAYLVGTELGDGGWFASGGGGGKQDSGSSTAGGVSPLGGGGAGGFLSSGTSAMPNTGGGGGGAGSNRQPGDGGSGIVVVLWGESASINPEYQAEIGVTDTSWLTTPTGRYSKGSNHISWWTESRWDAVLPGPSGYVLTGDLHGAVEFDNIIETRADARPTVLYHNETLWVLRAHPTATLLSSWDHSDGVYTPVLVDIPVPLTTPNHDESPMAFARTNNGNLWAACFSGGTVRITRSIDSGATWGAAETIITANRDTGVVMLSAVGTRLLVFATENDSGAIYCYTISEDATSYSPGIEWSVEALPSLSGVTSDDHGSATVYGTDLYIVSKTSDATTSGQDLIYLLHRSGDGTWMKHQVVPGPDSGTRPTRPSVATDGVTVWVFYGHIHAPTDLSYKTASVTDLDTWSATEVLMIGGDFADGALVPTTVPDAASGLLVLAHNLTSSRISRIWLPAQDGPEGDGPFTLSVEVEGNGTVAVTPEQTDYEALTEVMLSATPDEDWAFAGWSGDVVSGDNPLHVTMNSNKTVLATFTEEVVLQTVSVESVVYDSSVSRPVDVDVDVVIAGTNRYLLVGVGLNNDENEEVVSVTLDPEGASQTSLSRLDFSLFEDDSRVELWGLVNPPEGEFSVQARLSNPLLSGGEHALVIGAWVLTNVDQDTPVRNTGAGSAEDFSVSAVVNTKLGDSVFGVAFSEDAAVYGYNFLLAPPSETDWDVSRGHDGCVGGHCDATAVTTTMTWNANSVDKRAAVAVALIPATSAHQPSPDGPSGFYKVVNEETVTAPVLPTGFSVPVKAETQLFSSGTGDIADDPAIWVNPDDPAQSVVLGSKKAASGGGVAVYNLSGTQHQFLNVGEVNNIDLRTNVFGDRILVVGSNRTNNSLSFMWLNPATRQLSNAGSTAVGFEPYGCCLYVSPVSGNVYAFVTQNSSPSQIDQYQLTESGGIVTGTKVRDMSASTLCEGCVCDDENGYLFLTEEDKGFYRYNAEPDGGSSRATIDTVGGGHLVADAEGVDIAYGRDGSTGYLVVSSQGNSTFQVYDLSPPHAWRRGFTLVANGSVDAVTETDGLAISWDYLGPEYPNGILVTHDNNNSGASVSNFKFTDAGLILGEWGESTGGLVPLTLAGRWDGTQIVPITQVEIHKSL